MVNLNIDIQKGLTHIYFIKYISICYPSVVRAVTTADQQFFVKILRNCNAAILLFLGDGGWGGGGVRIELRVSDSEKLNPTKQDILGIQTGSSDRAPKARMRR